MHQSSYHQALYSLDADSVVKQPAAHILYVGIIFSKWGDSTASEISKETPQTVSTFGATGHADIHVPTYVGVIKLKLLRRKMTVSNGET
jgi:hypothetical protein